MAVAGIGIGDGEIADDGADGVLVDRGARQRDVRRHFVHVVDADDEGLGAAEAALVGRGDVDADGRRRLEVQALAGDQFEMTGDHLETRVRDAEGVGVAGVGIDDAEGANDSADGVLVHRGARQRDVRRDLVDIVHGDGERRRRGEGAVARHDRNAVAGVGFEIE